MKRYTLVLAALPVALIFGFVVGIPLLLGGDSDCPPGTAGDVDVAGIEGASTGTWNKEQVKNAAIIAATGAKMGISARGQVIAIMTAMGESSLTVLDRGDAVGPDSRGLFQQRANGAWGSYEDRMNPVTSSQNFYRALTRVDGWAELEPTIAAHRTQHNADPNHYTRWWEDAKAVYAQVSDTNPDAVQVDVAPACVGDDLVRTSYSSGADCDFGTRGFNNPRSCRDALAAAEQIRTESPCTSTLPGGNWFRWCLAFVARTYGHEFAGYPTARAMFNEMKRQGLISTDKNIPAGALVFFDSSGAAGHVALYAGDGLAYSNDYIRSGCIDLTPMSQLGSNGGYLGWSPPAFPNT